MSTGELPCHRAGRRGEASPLFRTEDVNINSYRGKIKVSYTVSSAKEVLRCVKGILAARAVT